uniref:MANSC domain-containing protein n=1 Tax=Anopheles culicifacies TaxID=139723 RepID=A0A182M6E8_9DIPT
MAPTILSHVLLLTAIIPYRATVALPEGTFPVAKRMNIETCLVRFDVHLNTIIRTEESRSMGARFLDDADLNSREQCLRLCCETENCDVFVFEEKSPGTCFLFQCGPPENFRCKFTRHSNYTSAVLSMPPPPVEQPPPPPPLAAQIQSLAAQPATSNGATKLLSQHEMELVSLKDGGGGGGAGGNSKLQGTNFAPASSTTPLPPLGVRLGEIPTTPSASTPKQQLLMPAQQCGHFEFPCHSGECIAVYNVCDGIPQCEDGSDEGAECPQKNSGPIISSPAMQGRDQGSGHARASMSGDSVNQPVMMIPSVRGGGTNASDSHIFNHKGGLQLSAVNNLVPPSQQYQETLPDSNYMPSSSVIRAGGGKSYLTIAGSNSYPQQALPQFPAEQSQQQLSYKSVLPSQWMGSSNMRASNWPLQPGDGLPPSGSGSDGVPPREQYIQPPVQQQHPAIATQDIQSTSNGADGSSIPLQQPALNQPHPSGVQWTMASQGGVAGTPTPPGTPSVGDGTANRAGLDSPLKDPSTNSESLPSGAGAAPSGSKHKPPSGAPSDSGTEYEEDAYDDTYPESTNAAAGADDQPSTQTEPPKKKARKHHKHEHGANGKQAGAGSSDADSATEQTEQKKKKKTKTIKKDKVANQADHEAGTGHHGGSDPIVHEHLKALHKELEIEFADHDGYADRPGGAMLSLTLGVLLTAAMELSPSKIATAIGFWIGEITRSKFDAAKSSTSVDEPIRSLPSFSIAESEDFSISAIATTVHLSSSVAGVHSEMAWTTAGGRQLGF